MAAGSGEIDVKRLSKQKAGGERASPWRRGAARQASTAGGTAQRRSGGGGGIGSENEASRENQAKLSSMKKMKTKK